MPGTLYVVATPIGNLEDLTFRALRTLKEVQLIAAEDTRRTAKLLAHYDVRCPMVSLHAHNEFHEAPKLVDRLLAGTSVALVSDAGTPGIADPGARLVRLARERGVPIVPIPGPSAVAAAISVAGLDQPDFLFAGFVPSKGRERELFLDRIATSPSPVVCFETPHRIRRTLDELYVLTERPIFVLRETTKSHEYFALRPISSIVHELGEFTLVIGPLAEAPAPAVESLDGRDTIEKFDALTKTGIFSESQAETMLAALLDLPPSRVAKVVKKARIDAKQGRLR